MEKKTKKIKVRELVGWPPGPGGAIAGGEELPIAGQAVVTELTPLDGTRLMFKGEFMGCSHSYHFSAATEKIASRLQTIIGTNMGKTVAQLGDFEIEVEQS